MDSGFAGSTKDEDRNIVLNNTKIKVLYAIRPFINIIHISEENDLYYCN